MSVIVSSTEEREQLEVISDRIRIRIPLRSILWMDTRQNAMFLHTDSGVVKTYMTFTRMRALLEEKTDRFLTCYKGCLVNMERVARIEDLDFLMEDGTRVQVRKRDGRQIRRSCVLYRRARRLTPA